MKTETTTGPRGLTITEAEPAELEHPTDWGGLMALSEKFAKSALCPGHLKGKPEDVVVVMLAGRDYGLSEFQSVFGSGGFYVIQGQLSMEAQLMRAIVQASPVCRWIREVDSSDTSSTWETRRHGHEEPDRETFTLDEARSQGLLTKPAWKGNPGARTMLSHRACARLCRRVYADVLKGVVYTPEELRDGLGDASAPPAAPEAASKADRLVAALAPVVESGALDASPEEVEGEVVPDDEDDLQEVSAALADGFVRDLERAEDAAHAQELLDEARGRRGDLLEDDIRRIKDAYTEALRRFK